MILVLLPGLDGMGALFEPFLHVLPARVQTLVLSYPTEETKSYPELIEYVQAQLPKEDFLLVAESFSGFIAYQLALRSLPQLRGVVFVATFLRPPVPRLLRWANKLPLQAIFASSPPDFVVRRMLLGKTAEPAMLALFRESLQQVAPEVLAHRLREVASLPIPHQKSSLKAIYLQAIGDSLVPQKSLHDFQSVFPSLRVFQIQSPHLLLQSRPQRCAELLMKQWNWFSQE